MILNTLEVRINNMTIKTKSLKVVKNNLKYAVIKIHWNFTNDSEISYLHHNSDNIFDNKESAVSMCKIFNDKNLEDDSFMVVEIPLRK